MSITPDGAVCACGNRGCFEAYGSGTALAERAKRRASEMDQTLLGQAGAIIDSKAVFDAAKQGDELAIDLVREEAEILGRGFTNLLHLFSPDILVMGGGVSNEFDTLKPGVDAYISRFAMPAFRDVQITKARLGQNSGLVGVAGLVFASRKASGEKLGHGDAASSENRVIS